MPISVRVAEVAAQEWAKENLSFKGRCTFVQRGPSTEVDGRVVEIRFRRTYVVMKLLVTADKHVTVLQDCQQEITDLAQEKFGDVHIDSAELQTTHEANVRLVAQALTTVRNESPELFDTFDVDMQNGRGGNHDLILRMTGKKDRTVDVWIKIVRTKFSKATFNKRNTETQRMQTVSLTMHDVHSAELVTKLTRRLEQIRTGLAL